MLKKETEVICCKPVPNFVKPGKKFFCILILINIAVLWFVYKNDLLYFDAPSKHNAIKSVDISLYNMSIFNIPLTSRKEMNPFYIEIKSNLWCFIRGINLKESRKQKKCFCIDKWFGLDCGIPGIIWKYVVQEGKNVGIEIVRREKPRRIILSIMVDKQHELLDIIIHEAFAVVDVFVIAEEKDTLSLLTAFDKGFLSGFQSKILPINVSYDAFSENTSEMHSKLWTLTKKRLGDFRPDDIILFSHVSSIISKDVLLFLKLYDGYTEPFFFELRPLLLNFYSEIKNDNTTKNKFIAFRPAGCTFQYISSLCKLNAMKFFTNSCSLDIQHKKMFEKNFWKLREWTIGDKHVPSGWHCNMCCKPDCVEDMIKKKMASQNFSASFSVDIQKNMSGAELILKNKKWFDGTDLNLHILPANDPFFAPTVVINNWYKYSFLIQRN